MRVRNQGRFPRRRTAAKGRLGMIVLAVASGTVTALAVAGLTVVAIAVRPAAAATPCPSQAVFNSGLCSQTFGYTGAEQVFTVPAGLTKVHVLAAGAAGGTSYVPPAGLPQTTGGQAASVSGWLTHVTGGQQLYVEVGGTPTNVYTQPLSTGSTTESCPDDEPCTGGFNGGGSSVYGGGGGGASDVRTVSSAKTGSLGSRLIVGAGGGGGGAWGLAVSPPRYCTGLGGAAGTAGTSNTCAAAAAGGGGAGTGTAGGIGGADFGQSGQLGIGGQGGGVYDSGGGGGGGLYGGGSGGGSPYLTTLEGVSRYLGGGGGGGSSLVPAGGSLGETSGPSEVVISWGVPALHVTAPGIAVGGAVPQVTVTEGFTDDDPYASPSDYSGIVSWGDGSTTAIPASAFHTGPVAASFWVSSAHTYHAPGVYTITVTINAVDGASITASTVAVVEVPG